MTRTCLITGASRGLGFAMARALLQAGHRVALTWTSKPGSIPTLAPQFPGRVLSVHLDQGKGASVLDCVSTVRHQFGAIEVLINNGAISDERPFLELDDEAWHRMLDVNLMGPVRLIRELVPAMAEARWGRIVNVASIGGQWGGLRQVHYAASKAALINLTRSLAKVYAGRGIVPIALAPGLYETDMTAKELQGDGRQAKLASIPAGQLGNPNDLGELVTFLLSEGASYLQGQTLNLNGGMYFGG